MENKDYLTLEVKRKINVTWDDEETNQAIDSMVEDAIITLNEKLGANIDYSKPGMERNLFKNYCLYAWNDWLDDFDKKYITVRKAIKKMCDSGFEQYKFLVDGKVVISSKGIEWICKNVFKQKYLELLEKYKMELTEKYIKAGYPYDIFFGRN